MEMLRVKEKYCMVQQGEIINQDAAKMLTKLFSGYTKELRLLTFQERRMSLSLVVRGNSQLKLFGQNIFSFLVSMSSPTVKETL
jgi:hypothetical protein